MTIRPKPTSHEKTLGENDFIVSKTDLKGLITYGNRIFINMSGYSERELLGAPHNILRHPDMPRAAFKLMWNTLEAGQEFNAYVKNLAKDGSYYWVFANITPSLDARGTPIGYYSVRRKPRAAAIQAIAPLYQVMLDAERRAGDGQAGMKASTAILLQALEQKGMSYDEFIFGL